ncbi:MAG: hypothetical protein FWD77_01755 [Betaproteobacteria bacterium]|nr:hypothetical protein [Betaproteobacteria bacterium]
MKFIETAKTLLLILPSLIEAIRAVENLFPESGQGAAKLAMVRAMISAAWERATDITGLFESAWPSIESAINGIVSVFNSFGWFKK